MSRAARTAKPRRFVRMFQPQFAEAVRERKKRQTIRPAPKRMPRKGDILAARRWTGLPYRSRQETLVEATIVHVEPVGIERGHLMLGDGEAFREYWLAYPTSRLMMDEFARWDGFHCWDALELWFLRTHDLPFSGIVISW